ncbi:unnamed protein product [Bursaphelenchus xylophilus]|uniref:(pine wood nematode) hypothetical protein n=1 Tax=Bursaphelenchus xylophilus TaxID=6326 RepID=A0A1I7STQ6_BURXY|nr:unnamed protein product [Bursaphelenchus xylophilus]CAG9108097.1 unnamed protein product [Bursaphelenchus xylophilus]
MLIKEYRILLPLTVEEYQIAQLYMIQKKSRLDSSGAGSGVEILTNEPYEDGPGGKGQYTFKIYHVGNKIPTWIRNILPSSAMEAHEEAWNAYPYTKTRYSCPMLDRISVDMETIYCNDAGVQDNVFNLSESELKQRQIDVMDFVNDPISSHDYTAEEDPRLYVSRRTGRGPLKENWVEECLKDGKPIMCAYKLCRVEFRYWGMQTRAERWIHDLAFRRTLLTAHRQAWAWQDEWVGLTIADIRALEQEVAAYLSQVMQPAEENVHDRTDSDEDDNSSDVFFDCCDQSPPCSNKPSLIRWSSELLVGESDESPPHTPRPDPNSSLLILVFHGDIYPESPADSKTTDANTLKSTLDTLITGHYPQLKGRVYVQRVTCGQELCQTVSSLNGICPSFGSFHPSLALLLASSQPAFFDAVNATITRANQVVDEFYNCEAGHNFNGEIFAIGDCIGGILMYEALLKQSKFHLPISRHSSSVSTHSKGAIPEGLETDNKESSASQGELNETRTETYHQDHGNQRSFIRNLSAPPSASFNRKKMSISSMDTADFTVPTFYTASLSFRPTTAFLLGCPLALILAQRKMHGKDVGALECNQLFNLFYSLDTCGARLEPVLNPQLSLLPCLTVPRYQRYPLGDGRHILFDNALETSMLWGSRRVDHELYCPPDMIAVAASALPNILHASYWESKDVGAFILRQFVRSEDNHIFAAFSTNAASMSPLNVDLPNPVWSRRRTRFKVANLSPNHRANDLITIEGLEQVINARFCYGPMDLVALSREDVVIYVCPYGGDWYEHSTGTTDSHGRLVVNMNNSKLPVGIHSVKMIVKGDHSFLNMYIAIVPPKTPCVVFSIDGSLTASVSVTGRDPRVRPGAVDVVRFWQQKGYIIIYVTARPDMQQRVVGSWLAQHNFPHGLLFFTPSISTDPLRYKTQHLRHLVDMGVKVQAAYGSGKDIGVYSAAGIDGDHIFKVHGNKRRGCISLEDGYVQHLHDLHSGRIPIAQTVSSNSALVIENNFFTALPQQSRNYVQRTHSFTPRSGKYGSFNHQNKKSSQSSISTR